MALNLVTNPEFVPADFSVPVCIQACEPPADRYAKFFPGDPAVPVCIQPLEPVRTFCRLTLPHLFLDSIHNGWRRADRLRRGYARLDNNPGGQDYNRNRKPERHHAPGAAQTGEEIASLLNLSVFWFWFHPIHSVSICIQPSGDRVF